MRWHRVSPFLAVLWPRFSVPSLSPPPSPLPLPQGVSVTAKLRFLVDRQMDPNAAAHQYVAHRRWKQQYYKDSCHVDESELGFFRGCDYGCFQWVAGKVPLLVNRAKLHNTDRCNSHDIASESRQESRTGGGSGGRGREMARGM